MNATVIDQEHCRKQLRLEIPSDTVRVEMDRIAGDLSRKIRIPGFRPGHVPKSVVKTRFRKELRDEVVSQLLPQAFGDAVKERDLKVVGEPDMDELVFGDDESIKVLFSFEVAPSFELADYKNIELTKPIYKVTDEDVKSAIEALREKHAELVPIEDRPSQSGDLVTVSIEGAIAPASGEAPAGNAAPSGQLKRRDYDVNLGAEGVLPEFTAALSGKRVGDNVTFAVDYPEDFSSSSVAGRHVDYTAEVIAVREKQLPDLDDEFATSVDDEYKTMAGLEAQVRENLQEQAASRTAEELKEAATEKLLDLNRFEVPTVMVEQQVDNFLRSFARHMAQRNADPAQLKNIDWQAVREVQRERAEKSVRWAFIMNKIATLENIKASDEEVDDEIMRMARAAGKPPEAIRANLTKEHGLDSIKEQIESRKALDLVLASAQIKEEEHLGVRGSNEGRRGGAVSTEQAVE